VRREFPDTDDFRCFPERNGRHLRLALTNNAETGTAYIHRRA